VEDEMHQLIYVEHVKALQKTRSVQLQDVQKEIPSASLIYIAEVHMSGLSHWERF
jgi:hypothetical protein